MNAVIENLQAYWPLWLPLIWMGVYELWALHTRKGPTITHLVRTANSRWPRLTWVVVTAFIVLAVHFFWPIL